MIQQKKSGGLKQDFFFQIVVPEDDRRNSTRLYNRKSISDLYILFPKVILFSVSRLLDI